MIYLPRYQFKIPRYEAINNEFSDLKARSKVRMKHFKIRMTGVCYGLAQIIKPTSNVILGCLDVKQQE